MQGRNFQEELFNRGAAKQMNAKDSNNISWKFQTQIFRQGTDSRLGWKKPKQIRKHKMNLSGSRHEGYSHLSRRRSNLYPGKGLPILKKCKVEISNKNCSLKVQRNRLNAKYSNNICWGSQTLTVHQGTDSRPGS